tara:strand:- start:1104 stop:1379 length:276 start_codon:yes stop_codon:yes gene_type:complete
MDKIVLGRFYFDKEEEHVVQARQKANTSSILATRHSPTPFFVKASTLREASKQEVDQYKEETEQRKNNNFKLQKRTAKVKSIKKKKKEEVA